MDRFSLIEGGPIYRFQKAIGMALPDRRGVVKRAFLTTLVTWIPLLLLSLLQHRSFDSGIKIPFLSDFAVSIRFLVGLPLLVIAETVIDPRLNHAVKHFVDSGLVTVEKLPAFEEAIRRTNRLRDSALPAILILVAAFAPSIWYRQTEFLRAGISTWHTMVSTSGEHLSLAGWWFGTISLPLYRVLLFRWIWIILLWTIFLKKASKIELHCIGTHPDTCGGLGFLAEIQPFFGFIGFACSAVMAGALGNEIAYQGATVSSLKFLIIVYCVLAVILLAAPLLVLTPKLAKIKRRDQYHYGTLGVAYSGAFEAKWIQGLSSDRESLLGTSDIQSLADLYNSFSIIREMNVVLIDKRLLAALAFSAILPILPMIVIATPTQELVRAVLKLLV